MILHARVAVGWIDESALHEPEDEEAAEASEEEGEEPTASEAEGASA